MAKPSGTTTSISVAIDWGSSSFRAYRFDGAGQAIDSRVTDGGIKFIAAEKFETYLREQVGDWLAPRDSVLLSGMIGSRNGWVEADYLPCPVALDNIINALKTLQLTDMRLLFIPGLCQSDPADVMRGEELQLLGASLQQPTGTFVIPGTHSKWAWIRAGRIDCFRTIPTGELFDLVINHSLIGSAVQQQLWDEAAFVDGVNRGYNHSLLLSDLFTARSRVLLDQQSGAAAYAWLSGLLIGSEIREGCTLSTHSPEKLIVIGTESLCRMYRLAADHLNIASELTTGNVALNAFAHIVHQYRRVNQ